jgi:hypothetical protein
MRFLIGPVIAASLVACGDAGDGVDVERCTLSNQDINETQWVMWEALPGGKTRENSMARMQFFQEEGVQKVRYTVKSLADAYLYTCEAKHADGQRGQGIKEWFCKEETHLRDWCQALEVVQEGSCTAAKLQELGAEGTPKEFEDGIKKAKETVAKYRDQPTWGQFRLNNNTLANKLQGLLYVKMKKVRAKSTEQRCQLSVTDMYMTLYEGRRIEDSNPVGTNPFIQTKEAYDYAHCTDPAGLRDYSKATLPKDLSTIPRRRLYEVGQTVYYHYMGEVAVKAVEGCTYSRDVSAQWRPVSTGEEVAVSEQGVVQWNTSHAWTDLEALKLINDQAPTGILKMERYQTCADGKKETIDVLCTPAFMVAPPQDDPEE